MANRDRVKLAFIHVPDEGSGAVGGRQVQGLGRVRGWMTPAQAGWHWHWQVVCRWVCLAGRQTGTGLAGLEAALARGMAGQQRRRQASSSSSAAAARAARTILTTEPKRRSLKIWVGMQAEVERACLVGGWATACSTNPLGCVGYRQSAWAGVVVAEMSVHGYLTCVLIVSDALQATSRGGRQAGLTRACACLMGVRGRSNERVCERVGCMQQQQQHMRGRHGRRASPTVTST